MRERVWCHEMLISCCTIVLFSSSFFNLSSTAFEISLFLCFSVWHLNLVVLSSSFKVEEFLHKMAISLNSCRIESKTHSSLARWHDLPFFSGDHLLRRLDILSVDLDTSVSLPQFKTQLQKAFSPNAGALSLWHSPPQWIYGRVRVPRNLDSLLCNCPVLHHFHSEFYFSRWGWDWVHVGSFGSMLRTTIVSDRTQSIHHQSSLDFSSEDRSNT